MKKILQNRGVMWLVLFAIVSAGVIAYMHERASYYGKLFVSYQGAATILQNAAFTPGSSQNPLLQDLNQTLSGTLDQNISDAQRLALAQHGSGLIRQLNVQVDAMGDTDAASSSIDALNTASRNPLYIEDRGELRAIVSLAVAQMGIISQIRALSYKANFESDQIFNQIIASQGALTDAYVTQLNDELPGVGDDFDSRTDLYYSLQSNISSVNGDFSTILKTP